MIDLHVHSCCSDGTDSPRRLVELAASCGCELFALTDHDTLSGVEEAQAAGREIGVDVICGVELSCHFGEHPIHLLGYFPDGASAEFCTFLSERRQMRNERNEQLAESLQDAGIDVSLDEVLAKAKGDAVGRPHFAAVLMEKGYVESVEEAFDRYLGAQADFFVSRRDLDVVEAIEMVRSAGGFSSWAHPMMGTVRVSDLEEPVAKLAASGLDGLESWYSKYTPEDRRLLARMARRHAIVPTGGSDYHGSFKPGLSIGKGRGDLSIARNVFEELISSKR